MAQDPNVALAFQEHTQLHMMAYNQTMMGAITEEEEPVKGQVPSKKPSAEDQTGETSQARSAQTQQNVDPRQPAQPAQGQ